MSIGYSDGERLFEAGEFTELVRQADISPAKPGSVEPRLRVLVAHALALTGEFVAATELVGFDVADSASPSLRSRVAVVLGSISAASGDFASAAHHLDMAIRLARDAGDPSTVAWAHLARFRMVVDTSPIEAAMALLPDVRHAITKAGHPHLTAYLHICVAVLEGQNGRIGEALRHSDIADSLLKLKPNLWLESKALQNRACIAHIQCDLKRAAEYIDLARRAALKSGYRRGSWILDSNLGHVQTLTGHCEKARKTFNDVVAVATAPAILIGAYEGLARMYLGLNELTECDRALRQIDEEIRKHSDLNSAYQARWAVITDARLRIKQGDSYAALQLVERFEATALHLNDVPLTNALHLVAAHAAIICGNANSANVRILAAARSRALELPDIQAQYYHVAGLLLQSAGENLGWFLCRRASRMWAAQGIVAVQAQIDVKSSEDYRREPTSRMSAESIVNALAAGLDLAHTPSLLGAELLSVVNALGCSPRARLVESKEASKLEIGPEEQSLDLGVNRGRRLFLLVAQPGTPRQSILLSDVLRIGRAAVALERARQEERSRAALWPASPAEPQAGALFLAEEMQSLLATARRIAPTGVPVLITGETGTGKEVLARAIHAASNRAAKTFLPFNCSATPKEMLDAQLFGHRRGAFTGANEHFSGVIRAAAGGTLFLDEIGETTLDIQPKLLRFLESSEVHPIGEAQPVRVDVRIIAATNADLDTLLSTGRFREDLFYRLNIVRLHIPPLRERRVEVPALANYYLQKHAVECGKGDLRLAEETMEYLVLYRWPGNVRQLANEMRRLAAFAEPGAVMMPEHLSPEIAASRRTIPASERLLDANEVVVRLDQPMAAAIQHLERTMVRYALKQCDGRIEETAAMLGLSRKGLYLKRQRFAGEPSRAEVA